MVLAVVEADAHVLHRIAREHAVGHRLGDALLDGGDEALRDRSSLDLVDELEARARLGGRDLDVAVAELPAATGLLLVAPVGLGGRAHGLLVGNPRRVELDLGAEALAHPVDDHLDVDLGQPGDDLLAGLAVAVDVERRVLLLEAADRVRRLVLVALGLGLEGERHHRSGKAQRRERHLRVLGRQHVAGPGLLQLRDGADVAGSELVDLLVLLALRDEHLADPLLRAPGDVRDLRVAPSALRSRRGTGSAAPRRGRPAS